MVDVVKKLSFDDTGNTASLAQTGNMEALQELRRVLEELRVDTQQRCSDLMAQGKQQADGSGDNDLKRLRRQFQTQKATFVNFDVKQRFLEGLDQFVPDAQEQEVAARAQEEARDAKSEELRDLKAQNDQAREELAAAISQIREVYTRVDAATALTGARLDALHSELVAHTAGRPPPQSPLDPGPDEAECQAMLNQEMASAKQLESDIATTEAGNAELEVGLRAQEKELASLRAEVDRLEQLRSSQARAADADTHYKEAGEWLESIQAAVSMLKGTSVTAFAEDAMTVRLRCCVLADAPAAGTTGAPEPQQGAHAEGEQPPPPQQQQQRTETADLMLLFQPGTSSLRGAKLSPAVVEIDDIVAAAREAGAWPSFLVREVHCRLIAYWQRQAAIEAAAEVYQVASVGDGQPLVRASVPLGSTPAHGKVECEVEVPWAYPSKGCGLRVARVLVAPPGVDAQALAGRVNGDASACGAGLRHLLAAVGAAAGDMMAAAACL